MQKIERLSWQHVIVINGVTEIPAWTFHRCMNNKRVILADTVIDIQFRADGILGTTMLFLASLYDGDEYDDEKLNTMIKDINADEKFALHKVCSSFEPSLDVILDTMEDKAGLKAFNVKNSIGITPSRYLKENSLLMRPRRKW